MGSSGYSCYDLKMWILLKELSTVIQRRNPCPVFKKTREFRDIAEAELLGNLLDLYGFCRFQKINGKMKSALLKIFVRRDSDKRLE